MRMMRQETTAVNVESISNALETVTARAVALGDQVVEEIRLDL